MGLPSLLLKAALRTGVVRAKSALSEAFNLGDDDSRSPATYASNLVRSPLVREQRKPVREFGPLKPAPTDSHQKVSSPDMSDIAQQLTELLIVAERIGLTMKKQQEILLDQIRAQNRIDKENMMETPYSSLDPNKSNSEVFSLLLDKLSNLNLATANNDKDDSGGILNLLKGKWNALFGGSKAVPKLRPGVSQLKTATGATKYRDVKTGRFIKAQDALSAGKGGLLARNAARIPGVAAVGQGLKAAQGAVARGAGKITPEIIKRMAIPIASKAVGRTVLKSIPIAGAAIGVGFAIKRLIEGDVVGAGIDAVSGLAGPLTAIPALIASIARDLYTSVYKIHPEVDPQAPERMGVITKGVKDAVEGLIKPTLTPKQAAMSNNFNQIKIPPLLAAPSNDNQKADNSKYPVTQLMAARTTPNRQPASTSRAENQTPAPSQSNPTRSPAAAPIPKDPVAVAPIAISDLSSPKNEAGKNISDISIKNEAMSTSPASPPTAAPSTPMPSMAPSAIPGFAGIGDVPDPTYYDSFDVIGQMYFGEAA